MLRGEGWGMRGWWLWYLARWEGRRGEHVSQVEVKGLGQRTFYWTATYIMVQFPQ